MSITLDSFLNSEQSHMLANLEAIVKELQKDLKLSPDDEPTIDIRLCVDKPNELSDRCYPPNDWTWLFRVGLSDYDPYHSDYCSASCVGLNTSPNELLEEMINGLDN
jgi:hypothetical protein